MCPRGAGERHYKIPCVMRECATCGFDKVHRGTCPVESRWANRSVPVRILADRTRIGKSGVAKLVKVESNVVQPWGKFLADTDRELTSFLIHDFVARWQSEIYNDMFHWLPEGVEMWVSDYIENFTCFTAVEIQQEFYNRESISIFITLVVRRRRCDEAFASTGNDFHLPENLACDVHVFISDDKTHDAAFACLCWEKIAQEQIKKRRLPWMVIHWTDGAPNQFKWTLPIWFLSHFYFLFKSHGLQFLWWCFFASCHGKGMQDAAGAWVKSVVARAILLGGIINSLRSFATYCEDNLRHAAPCPVGKERKTFTSG